jgi:hypothetical protein
MNVTEAANPYREITLGAVLLNASGEKPFGE